MVYMGKGEGGINRRSVLAGIGALTISGAAPTAAAPRRARTLAWRGVARLFEPERTLDLAVETRIELPLLRVRSTSYIAVQGPATARTLILDLDGVWMDRNGRRTPLPAQLGIHERQQYAIYALLDAVGSRRRKPGRFEAEALPLPPMTFTIGTDGYPIAVDLVLTAADDDRRRIAEHVAFEGRIVSHGTRWPRRFLLDQDGRRYFELTIDHFEATG